MRYNGYTNYETWLTALYFLEDLEESAAENSIKETCDVQDGYDAGRWAKEFVEDMALDPLPNEFAQDLIKASLGEVNWTEIGKLIMDSLENTEE